MLQEIGKITSAELGFEDHGIFGFNINFTFGSSTQGTGWYGLDGTAKPLQAIVEAVGVRMWDQLKGRTVFVLRDEPYGLIRGIEPLPTERGKRIIFREAFE